MIPFAGNPLNRASEKRTDSSWIESKRHDPSSLVLPMWRLAPLLLEQKLTAEQPELGLLRPNIVDSLASAEAPCIFLGLDGDVAVFALDVSDRADPSKDGPLAGLGHFVEARAAAQAVSMRDAAIIAQAKAMIDWHQRHGFCPRCGAATKLVDAGYRRLCGECKAEHFPRTDPVVIMLATDGDACLVGRGNHFHVGCFGARWVCGTGGNNRGSGAPRIDGRSVSEGERGDLLCDAAVAISVIVDDRVFRQSRKSRCEGGRYRDCGGPLDRAKHRAGAYKR